VQLIANITTIDSIALIASRPFCPFGRVAARSLSFFDRN